jgi:asparagine synthase (glutamine-hydrolysing)
VASAVKRLPRNETAKRGIHALGVENQLARFEHVFSLAPTERIAGLFRGGPPPQALDPVPAWVGLLPQMQHLDELASFQHIELRSSLPDELLMFADKLSMAHSLEVRVPYLDRTVVEFAERLTPNMKIQGRRGKWLHRQVCQRFLPASLLSRKKRGFAVNVVDQWFHSATNTTLSELLVDRRSLMYELLDPVGVASLLADHRSGKDDNHKLLFSLAMFEQWLRGTRAAVAA